MSIKVEDVSFLLLEKIFIRDPQKVSHPEMFACKKVRKNIAKDSRAKITNVSL